MAAAAKKLVPPDGGWGWVVAGAYALNNVVVLPLISGMGLVFQVAFNELDITATQGSLIITLNHGLGMLLSFFGGPLLSRFGYRKVAVLGAMFVATGVMAISFANDFASLIFAYSILTSIGVAAVMASFTLAINSFFKEKRSKAIGLGMAITGLGPILMPHLMNHLMFAYGWRQAVTVLAALCLHSLLAALLLRPASWYMKEAPREEELVPLRKEPPETDDAHYNEVSIANGTAKLAASSSELFQEDEKDYLDSPKRLNLSMRSLDSTDDLESRVAVSHPDVRKPKADKSLTASRYKWWESQEINLGSSINIFSERAQEEKPENEVTDNKSKGLESGCGALIKRYLRNIANFFDLYLLKDPIFVNILLGLSIAACAEINFSLLTPFILEDMEFDTGQIAVLMSIIGFSDMFFRILSPFIGDWCKAKPRVLYLVSLGMIVMTRIVMLYVSTYTSMWFIAAAIGVTKGIRTVYMNIVIPSYVPLERLPFASGIQMFVNGIILIMFGPILGVLKDRSGSYRLSIIILNFVTLITVVLWLGEFIYLRYKNRGNK